MNICEHLTSTAQRLPDKAAIVFEGREFTYAELNELSAQAAHRLTLADVSPDDRVAIMLPNVPSFVVWYFGALRVGAIAVSISTRLAEKEVAFVVSDCDAKVFVAEDTQLAKLADQMPDCVDQTFGVSDCGELCDGQRLAAETIDSSTWFEADPDDAALILYTSGTTGFAKGATLSHNNVRTNVHAFNDLCDMQPEDRILLAVPLFHCFGQNALLNSGFNIGATMVLQRGFDLNESKKLIMEHQVTQLYGVPTMFQLFHESCAAEDLSSVRYCFSAAAKLPVQVSERWLEKFSQPIYEGYGLTETSPFASYNHRERYVIGSIGSPIDEVEMKIVDSETGADCPIGELGEIAIRGPNVMLGYWNRPEDTAAAIRDGWFFSGDIGRRDERGLFYIVDRVKDMIAVGGLKVYPAEVERIVLDHPFVSQAAVVGFPDEVFGEQVVAFVVAADQKTENTDQLAGEIQQQCRDNLANFKVPKHVVFIDELPRNPSGKVLKTKLREYDLAATSAGSTTNQTTDVSESLPRPTTPMRSPTLWNDLRATYANNRLPVATAFVQDLVRVLSGNDSNPDADARFLEAGLDSLMIVEMSTQIQAEVGAAKEIPATLIFDHPRVGDLAVFLVETFEQAESGTSPDVANSKPSQSSTSDGPTELRQQVDAMSEEEALGELMRELGG